MKVKRFKRKLVGSLYCWQKHWGTIMSFYAEGNTFRTHRILNKWVLVWATPSVLPGDWKGERAVASMRGRNSTRKAHGLQGLLLIPSLTQGPSVCQRRCNEHCAFQINQLLLSPPKTDEQTKTYQQTEQGLRDFNMEVSAQKSLVILQIQTLTNPKALSGLRMGQTSLKDSGHVAWIRLA